MSITKAQFFDDLSNQLSDPIYLTEKTNELSEEIKHNCWGFAAPPEIADQITTSDVLEFIQLVKENYKKQLALSPLNIDLVFYLWFDEMAGHLCFNFINSNHEKLPFGCKLRSANSAEAIISAYLQSNYLEGIPWSELKPLDTPEALAEAERLEKEIHENFVLDVYQEKLWKKK